MANPAALELGGEFAHVHYYWRPYAERSPEEQAKFDALEASIRQRGIVNPLIVFRGHVLVGQRRCEIARKLGLLTVPVWDIQTDISKDEQPDRVLALRAQYRSVL